MYDIRLTTDQPVDALNAAAAAVWDELRASGELRRLLEAGGASVVDADVLAGGPAAPIERSSEGFADGLSAVVVLLVKAGAVGAAGGAGKKVGESAYEALRAVWTAHVLPRVRARFGSEDAAHLDDS